MNLSVIFLYITVCVIAKNAEACERPLELRGVEDYCWSNKVEIVDRIQHAGGKVLNFAKKTLGITTEEVKEPVKCDYYYCIFNELKVINNFDVPSNDKITTWIKRNVIYNQALILMDRVQNCSWELSNATSSGDYFMASNVNIKSRVSDMSEDIDTISDVQTSCDISNEYMKCLADITMGDNCLIFQYP